MAEHNITPPPELRREWREEAPRARDCGIAREDWLMDRAAQWGADQELEACCEWTQGYAECGDSLRVARRPTPPSLKKQALEELQMAYDTSDISMVHLDTIRRALEALPE